MAGLFSRVKTWVAGENLKAIDVNAEFNNIIQNLDADKLAGDSPNVSRYRAEEDPGSAGSESLPSSIAGELRRLRYVIRRLLGTNFWYDNVGTDLTTVKNILEAGLVFPQNRVESGRVSSFGQPMFLVPEGADGVRLDATPTPFKCYIKNNLVEQSSDLTLTGLAAPAAFSTLVNVSGLAGGQNSRILGENLTTIVTDTASGTAPTAGSFQAWKIVRSGLTEYFYARFDSNTQLSRAFRGFFFDSSDNIIPRVQVFNNDPITLCRAAYIFFSNSGGTPALVVTYNLPIVSGTAPLGASSGDWWLDTSVNIWKKYDGVSWADGDGLWIGIAVMDGSSIVGTRSLDFGNGYSSINTVQLEEITNSLVRSTYPSPSINVYGSNLKFNNNFLSWSMTADLDSGISEASSTTYYFYITPDGDRFISDVAPYRRSEDLYGFYHPFKPWRCAGYAFNNSGSNLENVQTFEHMGVPLSTPNYVQSASCGAFTTTSGSIVQITNLSVTIETSGGIVNVGLKSDGDNSLPSILYVSNSNDPTAAGNFFIYQNGSLVEHYDLSVFIQSGSTTADPEVSVPSTCLKTSLNLPAGVYTFTARAQSVWGSTRCRQAVLYAYEIPLK